MNQVRLWGSGYYDNRAAVYLQGNTMYNNSKITLLCVICDYIELKRARTNVLETFRVGFENNTLCYLNNLERLIHRFFVLS
jgi:hypothetical protein